MNGSGDHPEQAGPGGRSPLTNRPGGFSAVRGAALIGIAVIIGIVLLQTVDTGTTGPIGDRTHTTTTTATTGTTAPSGTTPTTTSASTGARPASSVAVQVLNGSGRKGAAGTLTTNLKNKGYKMLAATDAGASRAGTVIYYRPGWDKEAAVLATEIAAGSTAQTMPNPPVGNASADCVVVIGS